MDQLSSYVSTPVALSHPTLATPDTESIRSAFILRPNLFDPHGGGGIG